MNIFTWMLILAFIIIGAICGTLGLTYLIIMKSFWFALAIPVWIAFAASRLVIHYDATCWSDEFHW